MKNYFKKLKEGLVIGIGLGIGFLIAFSIGTFAYSKIETVKSGDILSADSYNELVNRVNDLELQNEGIYQNAFDTNEIWTGKHDALTGKKIYSKWIEFGEFSGQGVFKREHGIVGIEKIMGYEKHLIKKSDNTFLATHHAFTLYVNEKDLEIITTAIVAAFNTWIRLEYTKIND